MDGILLRGQLVCARETQKCRVVLCVREKERNVYVCKGDCVMGEIACEEDLCGGERERR